MNHNNYGELCAERDRLARRVVELAHVELPHEYEAQRDAWLKRLGRRAFELDVALTELPKVTSSNTLLTRGN
jgi:hypothetical protein